MVQDYLGDYSKLSKIYVGNLSYQATQDDLTEKFAEYGDVISVHMPTDRETGRPRGFAFVEMNDEDAKTAMDALDGVEWMGRELRVNEARPQEDRRQRRNNSW